jgi:hypothetical protein
MKANFLAMLHRKVDFMILATFGTDTYGAQLSFNYDWESRTSWFILLTAIDGKKETKQYYNFANAVNAYEEFKAAEILRENTEVLDEIENLVKNEFEKNGYSVNYLMPDGKHSINIFIESDDCNGRYFYVVEPNRVENGVHKPMTNSSPTAEENDFKELREACKYCFNMFAEDKPLDKTKSIDSLISRGTAICEQSKGLAEDLDKFKGEYEK